MNKPPAQWCCTGYNSECPLCPEYGTSLLDPCPGHPEADGNREAVDTARLHAERRHPDYEYATTTGPRKQWDDADRPPYDDNGEPDTTWERNVDAGCEGQGWERFDYTEESYWRRRKPTPVSPITAACAVHHTDGRGNTVPCPGYPHAPEPEPPRAKPRASVIEIIAKDFTPDEDGPGSVIIPREVRINGVSVFTADRDNGIKIGGIRLGDDMVTVNLTLVARRVVIAADGDLPAAPAPAPGRTVVEAALQHLAPTRPYNYSGPTAKEQP